MGQPTNVNEQWNGRVLSCSPPTRIGIFRPGDVGVSADKILRVHGYKNAAKVREDVRQVAERYAAIAEKLLDIEIHYRRVGIDCCGSDRLVLEDGTAFESPIFERYLSGCREVVAFVLTTGSRLDDAVKQHIDTCDLVEALFLESSGWLAVEQATRLFSAELRRLLAGEHLKLSMRLGPGYIYKVDGETVTWPLEQQESLFHLFDGHRLPVRLLESCAMLPKLSRSGLYGVAAATYE